MLFLLFWKKSSFVSILLNKYSSYILCIITICACSLPHKQPSAPAWFSRTPRTESTDYRGRSEHSDSTHSSLINPQLLTIVYMLSAVSEFLPYNGLTVCPVIRAVDFYVTMVWYKQHHTPFNQQNENVYVICSLRYSSIRFLTQTGET